MGFVESEMSNLHVTFLAVLFRWCEKGSRKLPVANLFGRLNGEAYMKCSGLFRPFSWFISNAHETREAGVHGFPPDMLHTEFEGGGARPAAKMAPSSMAREGIGGSKLAASILP